MAEDVTPSQVRARQFDAARRGYDRAEVERYLGTLADELERLSSKLERRTSKELAVGLDDPEALALELGAIGGEVAVILEAARSAADGMRLRASADVDEWRSSAEHEITTMMTEAEEQSLSMRSAAWNEGSSMLGSASALVRDEIDRAKEDSLFIRAEAEREAIRLTGDAKRDREESIRAARVESERVLEVATAESEGILEAARRQAELAQERARALEDRRAELLLELESTRTSIGHLEEQIESRRQELEAPEPIPEPEIEPTIHHTSDSGSVRIVAGKRSVTLQPVDAEEIVAEVVALRTGARLETESEAPSPPPEPETVAVIAPPPAVVPDVSDVVSPSEPVVQVESPEEISELDEEAPKSEEQVSDTDEIGSLFAMLRESEEEGTTSEEVEASTGTESNARPAQKRHSEGAESPAADAGPPTTAAQDPTPEEESEGSVLIPIQNAALKQIKRTLVDLQNDALENLRTDDAWDPPRAFTNQFKAPYADLAVAITGTKDDGGAAKVFAADLHTAVTGALSDARDSGAGEREVASGLSRVFRMWRADEAERRVMDTAMSLSSSS